MNVPLRKGSVPFVISYVKVLRRPKVKQERSFVGLIQIMKNVVVKAIEFIEDVAFETNIEHIDPGQTVSVHWAIDVEDPWDMSTGREKNLIAYRMLNDVPPSGVHFEIISSCEEETEGDSSGRELNTVAKEAPAHPDHRHGPTELTPEQYDLLNRQNTQQELLRGARGVNDGFQRSSDSAYAPRSIKTIEQEEAEGELNEESSHLGRPRSEREDD